MRVLIVLCLSLAAALPTQGSEAWFAQKVLPILKARCFECHSHGGKMKGGLALDSRSGWQTGGDNGPAMVPGKPEQSLLIKAVRYHDPDFEMPPSGRLPAEEIAVLEQWVKQGAPDPRQSQASLAKAGIDLEAGRRFWAFRPVNDPAPPAVKHRQWPRDALDHFILAAQEQAGIEPGPDANRETWLRRVSLDLTGLPPSEDELLAYLADRSPQADERVVDRLLGAKAYGERWARHWLDLTGYADMMGTSNSVYAEQSWRYRDYLIAAFNQDKPFDRFVREQIAGDLMPFEKPEERAENLTATGFLMVGDVEIVNPDKERMRADHIDSQMIKIGQAFLGMTLGCARCHDHKFDPIGVEDYYAMAGTLHSSPSTHKIPFGVWSQLNSLPLPETATQLAARRQREAAQQAQIAAWKAELGQLKAEQATLEKQLAALPAPSPKAGSALVTASSAQQQREIATPKDKAKPEPGPRAELTQRRDEVAAQIKQRAEAIAHAEFFSDQTPRAFAMQDGPRPADMPILVRGNPYAPSRVVPRGALRVASWAPFPAIAAGQSGRLQLAQWLADKQNPLTARVSVNRIWQKLFGSGLVPSVDYFGSRGERPTHPDLLDHLASRFMQGGWSQKALLRALVLSRSYRLSAANVAASMQRDPQNKLFWRMNRQRLDAEALRDALLAVSGELARSSGGPALVLEDPQNCGGLARSGINPPSYRHARPRPIQAVERTIYLPVMRLGFAGPDRLRAVFDFVDPAMIAGERPQTTVPTQSLFLLGNEMMRQRAQALAKLLLSSEADDETRLQRLWHRALNRSIKADERGQALSFLQGLRDSGSRQDLLPWTELCHSLLASNEFVFRF